jgi:hypothetical protein
VLRAWSLVAVAVAIFGLGVWLVSPRFEIDSPSLVDDWIAVTQGGEELEELFRHGNAEEQRFRPSWTVWNALQWHTFDAPDGLVGPNAWNLARLAVLVAGLMLLVALALPPPRGRVEAVVHAFVAGVPALLVVTVPKFARDLARFGTQEPLLVGGMALGGSLLVLAAREVLSPAPLPRARIAALLAAGSLLWLAGVYQKEISLGALPLLAAVLVAGRGRLRGWRSLSRARQRLLAAIAVVVALPLAHVAIESARIAARGDLVYGAQVDAGRGIVDGLAILYDWSTEVFSLTARRVVIAALVLTALVALFRRRLDLVALGALGTGAFALVLTAQSGVAVSRYYIPAYALAGVALALSLARLPVVLQAIGVAGLALAFLPATEARTEVEGWTVEERAGAALVEILAGLDANGCSIAMAGIDQETSLALAALVARDDRLPTGGCASGDVHLVLRPYGEGAALAAACARGALELVASPFSLEGGGVEIHRCSELGTAPVRDPALGVLAPDELVAARRFEPAD